MRKIKVSRSQFAYIVKFHYVAEKAIKAILAIQESGKQGK